MPFFYTDFKATIIPVKTSFAKKTLPNFPSPSRRIILKFSLPRRWLPNFGFSGDLVWLRRKEGRVFSDRWEVISGESLELLLPEVRFFSRGSLGVPRLCPHPPFSMLGLRCFSSLMGMSEAAILAGRPCKRLRSSSVLRLCAALLYRSSSLSLGDEEGERGREWEGELELMMRLLPVFMLSWGSQRNWGPKLFLLML